MLGNDNNDDSDDDTRPNGSLQQDVELLAIEEQNRQLRLKLQVIGERRRNLARISQETTDLVCRCRKIENHVVLDRQQSFQEYQSTRSRRRQVQKWLELAQRWNVTDDCFHIWYDGDFGTLNNLRLGCESHVSAGSSTNVLNGYSKQPLNGSTWYSTNQQPTMDQQVVATKLQQQQQQQQLVPQSPSIPSAAVATVKVPWNEINSALGLVALLLSSLETRPQSNIKFQHEILPMGNTSKIGIRRRRDGVAGGGSDSQTTAAASYYPLYSDDRFHFFGKRNFNMALNALLQCLADAAEEITRRDRTMSIPHEVMASKNGSNGEWTIGGLSVAFGIDGEQWTRAMKYFLTDLKWCVAYLARHVDT